MNRNDYQKREYRPRYIPRDPHHYQQQQQQQYRPLYPSVRPSPTMRPLMRPNFKKRERDQYRGYYRNEFYPSPQQQRYNNQYPVPPRENYGYRPPPSMGYARPPPFARDNRTLKPPPTIIPKVTLLPTKKSPPPPSSSSSSEEDDDLFDQEEIEEQIDRIDNEIAKQERLLLQQKSKLSNDLNPSKKVVIKIPRICNPALNLEIKEPGTEQREMKHDGRPPKNTKELIDKIYSENRVLVSKLNVQHLENKTNFYNLVNGGSIQKPNYDAHLFEKLEIVNPNLRPAIVAFVKGRVMGTNYEQKKLGTRFRILEQEWRVKVEKMESKEEKEIVPEIPEIPKEENLIIETVVQPEGRSTRRGGIRSDVVRSEAEWQNALSLLGISNSNLDTVNIAKPNPYKASGLAKEIPLLSKYEIESLQKFHNNNDLVLDAAADLESFNQKQTLLWTEHDRNLFRQKLALHGKDFRKISEYLEGKSTQDCVSYYYREKINGRFKSMIKRASGRGRKRIDNEEIGQGCGFSTFYLQSDEEFVQEGAADDSSSIDSDRHNGQESEEHEVDLLDSATTIDLPDWTFEEKQRALRGFELFGRDFESVAAIVTTKTATQCKLFFNHQRRQAREPLISTEKKKKKRARKRTTEETNITNPEAIKKSSSITPKEATDDNSTNKRTISYWTVNERREFLVELEKHGRDWEKISAAIPTKSGIQVRNFFHNSRKKMNLDAILEQRGVVDGDEEEGEEKEPVANRISDLLNPISSETTNNAVASNIQETEILEEGEERNGDDERTNARFDYEGYDYHQPPQFQPYPYDYHHPYPYHQPEQPPYPSNSDRYGPTERYPPNETQYSAYGYPQNRPPYSPYPTYPPSYNYPNQPYHHQAQITEIDPNEVPISLAKIKTSSPTFAKVVVENEAESPFHLDQEESTEMEIDNSNNAAVQIEQESGEVMAVDGDESLQEMEGESTAMMSGVDSNQYYNAYLLTTKNRS